MFWDLEGQCFNCNNPEFLIITEIHELKKVIGDAAADAFIENPTEENLKACFSAMMNASKDTIASALSELLQRFPEMGKCPLWSFNEYWEEF